MTEERKEQAITLLHRLKMEFVIDQGKAVTKHDKEEYNRLHEAWKLLDDIEEALKHNYL